MSFRSPISKGYNNANQDFDLFEKTHFSSFISDENFSPSGFKPKIPFDNSTFDGFSTGADLINTYKNNINPSDETQNVQRSFLSGLGYSPIKLSQGDIGYSNIGQETPQGFMINRKFTTPPRSNEITPLKMFPKSENRLLFQAFNSAEKSNVKDDYLDELPSFTWNNNDQSNNVLKEVSNQPKGRNLNSAFGENQESEDEFDLKDKLRTIPSVQKRLNLISSQISANKQDPEYSAKKAKALKKSPKETALSTSQGETMSDVDEEDHYEDFMTDMKARGSRGLKVLSIQVRNILLQRKEATYKQIAEIIYNECRHLFKGQKTTTNETKDEKNMKRRVYDSLNILVASGILIKERRKVRCSDSFLQGRVLNKHEIKHQKEQLQHQLAQRKAVKETKLEVLRDLAYKSLALKSLIKRNQEQESLQPIESVHPPGKEDEETNDKGSIKLPFVVVVSPTPDNPINASLDKRQKELTIDSKDQLSILGDIDILQKLNLHKQISKEFFKSQFPQGLRNLIPKEFIDKLK